VFTGLPNLCGPWTTREAYHPFFLGAFRVALVQNLHIYPSLGWDFVVKDSYVVITKLAQSQREGRMNMINIVTLLLVAGFVIVVWFLFFRNGSRGKTEEDRQEVEDDFNVHNLSSAKVTRKEIILVIKELQRMEVAEGEHLVKLYVDGKIALLDSVLKLEQRVTSRETVRSKEQGAKLLSVILYPGGKEASAMLLN